MIYNFFLCTIYGTRRSIEKCIMYTYGTHRGQRVKKSKLCLSNNNAAEKNGNLFDMISKLTITGEKIYETMYLGHHIF